MLGRHVARLLGRRPSARLRPTRPSAPPPPRYLHGLAGGPSRPRPHVPGRIWSPWGHVQGRSFLPSMSGVEKQLVERRLVPFSPKQLYDVVSDVSHYREFVPFCVNSTVLKRMSETSMDAQLSVGFRVFTESYVSRVTMEPCKVVRAEAVGSSIFDRLISEWRFHEGPTPDQCDVEFMVDFKVSSVLHGAAVDAFFEDVSRLQISAFEQRCRDLYGNAPKPLARRQRRRRVNGTPGGGAAAAVEGTEEAGDGGARGRRSAWEVELEQEGASCEDMAALSRAFHAHAPDGHLPLSSFEAAWREASAALGASPGPLSSPGSTPLVAAVVFGAFDDNEDGFLNAKEFVQGVHLITRTGVEEQARLVYLQMDRNRDGLLEPQEVEAKLSRQLEAVRRVMPEVLKRGGLLRKKMLSGDGAGAAGGGGGADIGAEMDLVLACETLDILVEQAAQEVRAFVHELYGGQGGEGRGTGVTREEWITAVRRRPEVLNVLTIYGMVQMVQWAFATRDSE